jgi:hypothetical protein
MSIRERTGWPDATIAARERVPAAVGAIRGQRELYLHQCCKVGTYEPYVEECRLSRVR